MNRSSILSLVAMSSITIAGCASSGNKIEQANIQRIVIGSTTKSEMLTLFGQPLSQSFGSEGKLSMVWHYVYVGPFGTGMVQQNLAVLFDEKERVEKYNVINGAGQQVRLGQ